MRNHRFGIDIDGTVTDPATFIPHLNEHFNKNLTLDDIQEYDLTKALGVSQQTFWTWMQEHETMLYRSSILARFAKQTLQQWQHHFELYYISARPDHLFDVTQQWFTDQEVPYDHIELLGQHDKLQAVRRNKVDIFFEDKHDNAVNIAEECRIPVVLMETPYNQMTVPDNVYRAATWQEARHITEQLFQPAAQR
ncbi:5' nucleotidase, NT5C type [Alkalicoccus chagannorensis]|uniref:5' nucleotidase, NT5C type n=1 Tax=Alkalicoccus chagannorensis TaxID=427072 RepID=UPI000401F4D8|nr:nucleotidase [Alkalicoccus chagannorensis]